MRLERSLKIRVIEQAIHLLNERGWCKDNTAEFADGTICILTHANAARFSLHGALERALRDCKVRHGLHNLFFSEVSIGFGSFVRVNNRSTAAQDVVQACEKAIVHIRRTPAEMKRKRRRKNVDEEE